MTSFISSFRPYFLALAVVAAFETFVVARYAPPRPAWSNFLTNAFYEAESIHRLWIYEKFIQLDGIDADIVQVGDSSGLFSVDPRIVMRHLGGLKYVNMSCCAGTGFKGYAAIADAALAANPDARYLVYYSTITNVGAPDLMKGQFAFLGGDLETSYARPWRWLQTPSLALRKKVTDKIYRAGPWAKHMPDSMTNPYYIKGTSKNTLSDFSWVGSGRREAGIGRSGHGADWFF